MAGGDDTLEAGGTQWAAPTVELVLRVLAPGGEMELCTSTAGGGRNAADEWTPPTHPRGCGPPP